MQFEGAPVRHGDAFIPTPKKIVFRDFEVGKKYKQRCSLTNVSYTFNTFKVLDIDMEFRGLFDVEYQFPGRMSAGYGRTHIARHVIG